MIKNKERLIKNGKTKIQKKVRKDLLSILEKILEVINPANLIKEKVSLKGSKLEILRQSFDLSKFRNIYVVGAGKATYLMANALEEILNDKITAGFINVPKILGKKLKKIKTCIASHPIPNRAGVLGTKKIIELLKGAKKNDLVLALISGGGSALMPAPASGIGLADKVKISDLLIRSPASIDEINAVRKHISDIKGGRFTQLAFPATLLAFYISDVVGDQLDTIASGLTVPDESTFADAISILKKYKLWEKAPRAIRRHLKLGSQGLISETPKPKDKIFQKGKIFNFIIGNNKKALDAALAKAKKLKYNCLCLTSFLEGEIHEVSKILLSCAYEIEKYNQPIKKPALILAGGETTLDLKGKGQGGRNQELVLASISRLKPGMTILSFATDGVDGRTEVPVAGAIADMATYKKSLAKKLDINKFLVENDSYGYFMKLDELIKTGYTGTNVGDIVLVCIV